MSLLPLPLTAIVLAGGASRRMKRPKDTLPVGDRTLLHHLVCQLTPLFAEILLSTSPARPLSHPTCRSIADFRPGCGPLGGIAAGLAAASSELVFVIACDIPEVDPLFLQTMVEAAPGYDLILPQSGPGWYEPLFALYRKSLLPEIARLLAEEQYKILTLRERVRTRVVPMGDAPWFFNLNSPEDYARWQATHPGHFEP